MKWLRCVLLRSLLVLSVAYCAVIAALGVRSFWTQDNLVADHASGRLVWIRAERGVLIGWYQRYVAPYPDQPRLRFRYLQDAELPVEGLPVTLIKPNWSGFGMARAMPSRFNNALLDVADLREYIERRSKFTELDRDQLDPVISALNARIKSSSGMGFNNALRQEIRRVNDMQDEQWALASFRNKLGKQEAERHTERQVAVPMWALLLGGIWFPIIQVARYRRIRMRMRTGCCVACGYDIRATPQRCPECGTIPAATEGAAP